MVKNIDLHRTVVLLATMKAIPDPPPELKRSIRFMQNRLGAALVKNMTVLPNNQAPARKKGPGPKTHTMKRKGRFTVTGNN